MLDTQFHPLNHTIIVHTIICTQKHDVQFHLERLAHIVKYLALSQDIALHQIFATPYVHSTLPLFPV